jgi:hypothetical protein
VVKGVEEEAVLLHIMLQLFNKVEGEPVAHLVDLIEEGVDHIILDLELIKLCTIFRILGHELRDLVMQHISDRLLPSAAQLIVRLLVDGVVTAEAGVDVAGGGGPAVGTGA